jgi:raffinose/stachyose/melibiose transport system substrate-binding protein
MGKRLLLFLLLLGLSASCLPMQKTVNNDTEKIVTITVRNPKVEIAGQFEKMASLYEKSHPHVRIQTETVGGISDDFSDLKTQMAIGQGPDIFTNVGYASTDEWLHYLEDLSGESWIEDARPDTLAPVTLEGKVYGMPMNIEGFGIIYNKELFKKAGVDQPPRTFKELEAAAQKLNQNGVTPFANGYYEEWKLGHHLTSLAFAEQSSPEAFIESLSDNRTSFADSDGFRNLLRFVDLTLAYGNPHAATADYYTEMDAFRNGKAAMIVQGNWVEPLLENEVPKLEVGMFPIPLDDDGDAQLVAGVPSYWVVNKQSGEAEIREAKRFLRWMVESAEGREFQTEQLHFIPAFQSIQPSESGLSGSVWKQYQQQEGQNFNWSSYSPPLKEAFGQVLKQYVNEETSKRDALQDLDHAWRQHVSSK